MDFFKFSFNMFYFINFYNLFTYTLFKIFSIPQHEKNQHGKKNMQH